MGNRLPEQVYTLSWFVLPQIELGLHYFPKFKLDKLTEQFLLAESKEKFFYYDKENGDTPMGIEVLSPELPTSARQVSRLLFYPSWGTLGFTYHKGPSSFDDNLATLESVNCPVVDPATVDYEITDSPTCYYAQPNKIFSDYIARGIEFSKPFGEYTLKIEDLTREGFYEGVFWEESAPNKEIFASSAFQIAELRDWILSKNDGNLYVEQKLSFSGVGLEVEKEGWIGEFVLYNIRSKYLDRESITGLNIAKKAEKSSGADEANIYFPGVHYARRGGSSGENLTGGGLGFFSNAAGIVLYHSRVISEVLRLGLSFEFVNYFNQEALRDSFLYRPKEGSLGGIRFSFIYNF